MTGEPQRANCLAGPPRGLTPASANAPLPDMDVTRCPSPNFDERQLPVSMIVLHYTGMPDARAH